MCHVTEGVWNSCRDQLFNKWRSTRALVILVEQWNSALLFLHQLLTAGSLVHVGSPLSNSIPVNKTS
jgi:hypothetical protein